MDVIRIENIGNFLKFKNFFGCFIVSVLLCSLNIFLYIDVFFGFDNLKKRIFINILNFGFNMFNIVRFDCICIK